MCICTYTYKWPSDQYMKLDSNACIQYMTFALACTHAEWIRTHESSLYSMNTKSVTYVRMYVRTVSRADSALAALSQHTTHPTAYALVTMMVFAFPPRLSFRSHVSTESL